MTIAYVNGKFIAIDEPVIPIEDRGHQYGDGVYEVIRVYNGKPFLMDDHLKRLENSAEAIKIKLQYTVQEIQAIILEGLERSTIKEAEVYLQVTRGSSPRQHPFPDVQPSFTMTIREAREIPEKYRNEGVAAMVLDDDRWANCYIKSLNLLPNLLAKQEAKDNGCFEAILVKDGKVTEGSSTNVFAVKDGVLYTTPLSRHILPGITRAALLKAIDSLDLTVKEEYMTPEFIINADEIFITSTTCEVMPITTLNGKKVGEGFPGKVTESCYNEFQQLIRQLEGAKK